MPLYEHDADISAAFAAQAIERLKKERLPADPLNYEVFYVYYVGVNKELKKAMDSIIHAKGVITNADCKSLHAQHISEERHQKAYQRANDQIHATLEDVSGLMHNVKDATSQYGMTLSGVSQKIAAVKSKEEIADVLKDVVADTNKMLVQNRVLEEHLEKSKTAVDELKKDLERVRHEAMTDGLTGLANRKAFDDSISRLSSECTKNGTIFSILMLDIDHFKSFNDNFGHQVGDQVLRLVARTLTDGIKGRDLAARYGGEEFVILLPETNLAHAMILAESLRKSLAAKEVINRASGEFLGRITMSIGVAQYYTSEDTDELIERVDAALYTAKHNGRNQVAAAPTPHQRSLSGQK